MPTSSITAIAPSRGTDVSDCSCRLVRSEKGSEQSSARPRNQQWRGWVMASFINWRSSSATRSGVMG